jgi:putative molybdopterin biosynthesis protein
MDNLGISTRDISGYDTEVFTHFEVGLAVLSKEADTGIATAAVAKLLSLSFIPITRENFDMILDQSTFFSKGIQALIEVLKSRDFRKRVEQLSGYDFKDSGKVLYSTT